MSLREAAQQALEALEERYVGALRDKAMDALRTALAEPEQEPVQVTPIDFVTAVLGKEDCVGKPIMWAEWPNRAHGIGDKA